jgi:hypothetical protein
MDQKAINGAESQLPSLGTLTRPVDMIEDPSDLGATEVRVEDQTRFCPYIVEMPALAKLGAALTRSAILPHDGSMNGLSGLPIPHHRGLALIRHANGRNLIGRDPRGG